MAKYITTMGMTIALLAVAFFVHAEKASEIHIPIGQSPGLSGKYTVVGKIDRVNTRRQTLTLSDAAGNYTIKVTAKTSIYLDKSKVQRSNAYGSLADCKAGDRIEVKWKGNDRTKPVDWIKVQKAR